MAKKTSNYSGVDDELKIHRQWSRATPKASGHLSVIIYLNGLPIVEVKKVYTWKEMCSFWDVQAWFRDAIYNGLAQARDTLAKFPSN